MEFLPEDMWRVINGRCSSGDDFMLSFVCKSLHKIFGKPGPIFNNDLNCAFNRDGWRVFAGLA